MPKNQLAWGLIDKRTGKMMGVGMKRIIATKSYYYGWGRTWFKKEFRLARIQLKEVKKK